MSQPLNSNGEPLPVMADEPPPFLGSWPRVYLAVLVWLAILISLFYGFTVAFSR